MEPTLAPAGYRSRAADAVIAEALALVPAVVIEGPRGCGKTWEARSLLRLRDRVDTDRIGPPAKLAVIGATGYAYDRPDGITVLPITSLGP